MRLEEIINQHRQDLNDTDMVIYKYIIQHRAEARHISIHELAKNCAVSSTTIVRFAQMLGFDGFGELKAVLKMEEGAKTYYKEDGHYRLQPQNDAMEPLITDHVEILGKVRALFRPAVMAF